MARDSSSAIWRVNLSRIALNSGMQWQTRSILAIKRHFRASSLAEHANKRSRGTFKTNKVKTLPDDAVASNLETESASVLKVDYVLAAQTALQNV